MDFLKHFNLDMLDFKQPLLLIQDEVIHFFMHHANFQFSFKIHLVVIFAPGRRRDGQCLGAAER